MLDCSRICLTGPPSSGKTSLLFRQALHWAERSGRCVLFVAPSPLESLPLLPQTVGSESICQPDSHVLRRIHFKYPANLTELLHLLATLHIPHCQDETTPYDSIIVDDVHKFVSNQATRPLIQSFLMCREREPV
jgi:hypothetical protein